MKDKDVATIEDARAKARLILCVKLLDSDIIDTDSGGWDKPTPEEAERIVAVVSEWLWPE